MSKVKALESLSVFFPVYNEAENLPLLVKRAERYIPSLTKKYELIIINDGSTDRSQQIATQLIKGKKHWRLINHPRNLGYGEVLKTGIKTSRYAWIFWTDGDLQFSLAELKRFINYTNDYQAIIGYRRHRAEGLKRSLASSLFKIYIDLLFRIHVKDIDCAFKLIKADLLKKLTLNSGSAFTSSEILYRLKKQGVVFKELAVNHYPRRHGQATGNQPQVIIKACWEAFTGYLNIKFPLK